MTAPATSWGQEVVDLILADGVPDDDVQAIKAACAEYDKRDLEAWRANLEPGVEAKLVDNLSPKYLQGLRVVVERPEKGRVICKVHPDHAWRLRGRRRFSGGIGAQASHLVKP